MERILPAPHFHVVFTLPAELRSVALANPRRMHNALFDAARAALTKLGRQRLNGVLGVTAVLHTWTRELHFHPHVHCVVTAGAMDVRSDKWSPSRSRYLFPTRLMSDLFRSEMLSRVKAMADSGQLRFTGRAEQLEDPGTRERLWRRLWRKKWVVYAKKPFEGPAQVFKYLGRYTHRVAISDHRLLDVNADNVTVATRDGGTAEMTPRQFVTRWLLHVLPSGFHKIRHFGLYAPTHSKLGLPMARRLLHEASAAGASPRSTASGEAGAQQGLAEDALSSWLVDPGRETAEIPACKLCGGAMHRSAVRRARAPPLRRSL